ncbi:hypothetical protein CONLIGDRAFT_181149 [Coniochaeta ligniaria NRRL 30616]|uniref:Uncharacterized protein n=1 Tax=Coniochaeta ligniaria NRRL 30616 TaxID=1408157 RepID=A0A1J7J2B8_9PEZI|nr:hypothetical protein CONLIGDRAFT_181149 [Coniochaeta ligniaria NRRL 30616]
MVLGHRGSGTRTLKRRDCRSGRYGSLIIRNRAGLRSPRCNSPDIASSKRGRGSFSPQNRHVRVETMCSSLNP